MKVKQPALSGDPVREPKRPFFSIVIPTYNRPNRLTNCLAAIVKLDYPHDRFEVIVVDDGGKRPLNSIIHSFTPQLQICLIRQENQGPASARNRGAAAATGEYLAFTDDDCLPEPNWLNYFANQYATDPLAAIGGFTINLLKNNHYASTSQQLIDYLYQYYNQPDATFFTSNNISMPRKMFLEISGFDDSMPLAAGEDREFCHRWRHLGYQMVYEPNAVIRHAHRLTAVSFWQQHFNYGRGAWQYHQIRARRSKQSLQLEPFSFYWHLLFFPLKNKSKVRAIWQVGLMSMSQLANAIGFFIESRKKEVL